MKIEPIPIPKLFFTNEIKPALEKLAGDEVYILFNSHSIVESLMEKQGVCHDPLEKDDFYHMKKLKSIMQHATDNQLITLYCRLFDSSNMLIEIKDERKQEE